MNKPFPEQLRGWLCFYAGEENLEEPMRKIEQYIRKHRLITGADIVCVGISGGADSVFLLRALHEMPGGLSGRLCAVHVNHNLRGAESDEDEIFVRALCDRLQVPLYVYSPNVRQIAAERKIGTEEAGRLCRQQAFADVVRKYGVTRIALAHHGNDQAETFLFQLARGSSMTGLAGIKPISEIRISPNNGTDDSGFIVIHPLLCCTRTEIENSLQNAGQLWRTDRTNEESAYSRNKIRNRIIPMMEEQINAAATAHIGAACEDIREADAFIREEAHRRAEQYLTWKQDVPESTEAAVQIRDDIRQEPDIIQRTIIMEAVAELAGARKDLEREHIQMIGDLFERQAGSRISLPCGIIGYRDYREVTLTRSMALHGKREMPGAEQEMVPIKEMDVGDRYSCTFGSWKFRLEICDVSEINSSNFPQNQYTKWLDYDKMKHSLTIRFRQKGDRLIITSAGENQKLKNYMIDEKIPARERDEIPLLAAGNRVFWIVGYRISEDAKITDHTKQVLKVYAEPIREA